ncbi:DUF6507 family protein [Streptomyces griseoincarnatus]|uniref:Uncharacterized protein n=2 Tax=Streptomyces griseoincarnatus group TaxID=2867193 RepID=A0ABP6JS77_9ACTN|nr:DUF6507 family protein [Streptomyces variabilis]GGP50440.1 hypothetical protein GCM10010265_30400 [Streptomyces griseoincarnatus]GGT63969.1 hypothetical protein GCM10010287_43070 [Streptomyces variabilis]
MTGWDISPSGVSGVLKETAKAAEGLSNTGKALQESMPSAAKSAGTIQQGGVERSGVQGPVGAALGEFFTAYQEKLMYVAVRTSNSLNGAAGATNAYVKGDLDMAARAQANALKEPKIDLPGADGQQEGS